MSRARTGYGKLLTAAVLLAAACATGPTPTPDAKASAKNNYPGGQCGTLQLDGSNQPNTGRGTSPPGLGTQTDQVVATYRPGASKPAQLSARTTQERALDPIGQTEQTPIVLCPGKAAPTAESAPPTQGD
jgi:hypothetical protein